MFTGKKKEPQTESNAPLSPEADKFLAAAAAEFNLKQDALYHDWRFGAFQQWGYDQFSGILQLDFADGAQFCADGQALGSYAAADHSWEWAWNNPHIEAPMARDSQLVRQLGERLSISYLVSGMVPVPTEEFLSYLCAIGIKATGSIGVFRGKTGPIDVVLTLKNPRWTKAPSGPKAKRP